MADPRVQGIVEFILKDKGLLDAKVRLRELEAEVKRSNASFAALGRIGVEVGSLLKTSLAPLAVFAFLRKAAEEWEAYEKRLRATGVALQSLGIDAAEALPRVVAFLDGLAKATGIVDDETLPAFQKLIGITGSVDAALGGVRLAAGIAKSGMLDFAGAADAVSSILTGKMNEAAKALGINARDATGELKTANEVLAEAVRKFDSLAGSMDTAVSATSRLKASWDEFGDSFGKTVLPVWSLFKEVLAEVLHQSAVLVSFLRDGTMAASTALGALIAPTQALRAQYRAANAEYVAGLKSLFSGADEAAGSAEKLYAALNKVASRRDGGMLGDLEETSRKLDGVIRKAEQAQRESAAAAAQAAETEAQLQAKLAASLRAALSESRKVLDEEGKGREKLRDLIVGYNDQAMSSFLKRLAVERDAEDELRESEIERLQQSYDTQTEGAWYISDEKVSIAKQTLDEIAALELEALEAQRDLEIAAAEKTGADTAAIRAKWLNVIGGKIRSNEQALLKLEKMSTEERAVYWLQYAQTVSSSLGMIFGQSKALAIAECIINTALAVMQTLKVYGMTPWGYAAAALAAAAGLVQLQKIKSAGSGAEGAAGKGFDDPVSDRLAYHAGQRWAQDYINLTTAGFNKGIREGAMAQRLAAASQSITNNSSVTNDQSTGQVIHVHGAFIDSDSLRGLSRRLAQTSRNDAARFQR